MYTKSHERARTRVRMLASALWIAGGATFSGSCGGDEGLGEALEPEIQHVEAPLVSTATVRTISSAFVGSAPIPGDNIANDSDGTITVEAYGGFPDVSEGSFRGSFFVAPFSRVTRVVAQVEVTGGHTTVFSHPPFGYANAGTALALLVERVADGRTFDHEIQLQEESVVGDRGTPTGSRVLTVDLPPGVSGSVRVQIRLRAWATALGIDAAAATTASIRVTSVSITQDTGPADSGDVYLTSSVTGHSNKIDDTFGARGSQFEVGRVLVSNGNPPHRAVLAIDPVRGSVQVADFNGFILRPPGGSTFSTGGDICGPGRVCLLGEMGGVEGLDELLAFDQRSGTVRVFRSDGSTGFNLVNGQNMHGWCGVPFRCLLGDVTGDGRVDVVRTTAAGIIDVAAGGGPDGFRVPSPGAPTLPWHFSSCGAGERCALGDLDGDGAADLVAFDASGSVQTALSTRESFGPRQRRQFIACDGNADCQVADVDGDGKADLVRFFHDDAGFVLVGFSNDSGGHRDFLGRNTECIAGRVCRALPLRVRLRDDRADFLAFQP